MFIPGGPGTVTPASYQDDIAVALGVPAARAAQIAAEYPPGNDKASATVAFSALAGDASFACPALRIDQQTWQRVPAYGYKFKRRHRAAGVLTLRSRLIISWASATGPLLARS